MHNLVSDENILSEVEVIKRKLMKLSAKGSFNLYNISVCEK